MSTPMNKDLVVDVAELVRSLLPGDARSLAILDLLPIGVLAADRDGRQAYANAAVFQTLGHPFEGNSPTEDRTPFFRAFISGTNEPYPPDQLPSMRALRGEHARVMDLEIRTRERRVVLSVAANPFLDSQGKIAGSISAFHDVTEAADAALAYRALIERVPVGGYRVTPDGDFLLANPALRAMLGYSAGADLSQVNLDRNHANRQRRIVFKK